MDSTPTNLRNLSMVAYILLFVSMLGYSVFSYTIRNGIMIRNTDISTLFILMGFTGSSLVWLKNRRIINPEWKFRLIISDLLLMTAYLIFIFAFPVLPIFIKAIVIIIVSILYTTIYMNILSTNSIDKEIKKTEIIDAGGNTFMNFIKISIMAFLLVYGPLYGYATSDTPIRSWVPSWDTGLQYIGVLSIITGMTLMVVKDRKIMNRHLRLTMMIVDLLLPIIVFLVLNLVYVQEKGIVALIIPAVYLLVHNYLLLKGNIDLSSGQEYPI